MFDKLKVMCYTENIKEKIPKITEKIQQITTFFDIFF